jgi:hypothetical protein
VTIIFLNLLELLPSNSVILDVLHASFMECSATSGHDGNYQVLMKMKHRQISNLPPTVRHLEPKGQNLSCHFLFLFCGEFARNSCFKAGIIDVKL